MQVLRVAIALTTLLVWGVAFGQQQFELTNNWITNVSFVTGTDRGLQQNLNDNLGWMRAQGYTHLRFFGIYPNGYHIFPSAILDSNGFQSDPGFESFLAVLVSNADVYGIEVNFDGWEVLAESNQDTTRLGVGYITAAELAGIVSEVLSQGVRLITEEQFGDNHLRAIDSVVSVFGGTHETTALLWWTSPGFADAQLASVFSFCPYNQAEADSLIPNGNLPATLGGIHIWAEGAHYHNVPFSLAVGTFGNLATENWKNVLRFAQIQHKPERFSIEDSNSDFLIWNHAFNFNDYIGTEVSAYASESFGTRPVANLIFDASAVPGTALLPSYLAGNVNAPAIVNTLTATGYRVIPTLGYALPGASAYYILLFGGSDPALIAPLPAYVVPLLEGGDPVFVQPCLGIPDANDAADWTPVRDYFGLPPGETATLTYAVPASVESGGFNTKWGGAVFQLIPRVEDIRRSQVDSSVAQVVQSGPVLMNDVALVIRRGNKFLINSNLIHLEASYVLSSLLAGPIKRPVAADVACDTGKILVFAEHDLELDLQINWAGTTHLRRYNPHGDLTSDSKVDLGGRYSAFLLRGELVVLMSDPTCLCPRQGDISADGILDVFDVIGLIGVAFSSDPDPKDPQCPRTRGDVDGNGFTDVFDVIYLIGTAFAGGAEPVDPCALQASR